MPHPSASPAVTFTRTIEGEYSQILTPEAIQFLVELSTRFDGRREELLAKRAERWEPLRQGALPGFLPETKAIREGACERAVVRLRLPGDEAGAGGAGGAKTQHWPGIDIDIPTAAGSSKSTPEGTRNAVLAAFRGGADGVLLSRKHSEMRLGNLSGAGEAIRTLGLG